MTGSGRPVERPAHLSPEERQLAQQRTRKWREDCGLSQQQMAKEIGVGYPTYRPWENGKGQYDGPTLMQVEQLNRALVRLLGDRYEDGQAFDVWRWPRKQEMSYEQMVGLLLSAGFSAARLQAGGRKAVSVLWVHRLREPTLLHGVFALAAAAITRAGLPVNLLLDDLGLSDNRRREQCEEFESRVRGWVAFASGVNAKLSTTLYSTILTSDYLARRGWSAVNDYLNTQSSVLDFLLASKAVLPLQYRINARESVLALLRNQDSILADRLLIPMRNWLVFEAELARMTAEPSFKTADSIITLGGEDERILWDLWRRGCPDELSARVQHMYLKPMPTPSDQTWDEPALTAGEATTDRLTSYLIRRTADDGHSDLVEWVLRSAVYLPASLNSQFRDSLDPVIAQVNAPLPASGSEQSRAVRAVAKAVVGWFNP